MQADRINIENCHSDIIHSLDTGFRQTTWPLLRSTHIPAKDRQDCALELPAPHW